KNVPEGFSAAWPLEQPAPIENLGHSVMRIGPDGPVIVGREHESYTFEVYGAAGETFKRLVQFPSPEPAGSKRALIHLDFVIDGAGCVHVVALYLDLETKHRRAHYARLAKNGRVELGWASLNE